jgi:hypothetical protein
MWVILVFMSFGGWCAEGSLSFIGEAVIQRKV